MTTPIGELLSKLAARPRSSQRALAVYMGVSPTAVNEWIQGKRIPDPPFCWKIAELAKMPVEDVMRLAGHLPPEADPSPEPTIIPEIRALLGRLDEGEQRAAALPSLELAESILRRRQNKAEE